MDQGTAGLHRRLPRPGLPDVEVGVCDGGGVDGQHDGAEGPHASGTAPVEASSGEVVRHDRERDAYSKRKNEKPDRAPTEEEMDAIREQRDSEDSDFEDFDGIELKPLLTPLAIACREYLERNPSRRNETPSWLAGTLWAYELYPGKPTRIGLFSSPGGSRSAPVQ